MFKIKMSRGFNFKIKLFSFFLLFSKSYIFQFFIFKIKMSRDFNFKIKFFSLFLLFSKLHFPIFFNRKIKIIRVVNFKIKLSRFLKSKLFICQGFKV